MDEADNRMLMGEVTDIELNKVLHSFQKDAILGTGGLPIEFFLGFIDMVGGDLLKVVEVRLVQHLFDLYQKGIILKNLMIVFLSLFAIVFTKLLLRLSIRA